MFEEMSAVASDDQIVAVLGVRWTQNQQCNMTELSNIVELLWHLKENNNRHQHWMCYGPIRALNSVSMILI